MKTIQHLIMAIATMMALVPALTACTDYQDEINTLDKRVTLIENMVSDYQERLDAMAALISGLENNWYITDYMPIIEENQTVGYILNLRKDTYDPETGEIVESLKQEKTITIRNGEAGADAQFPEITPRKNADGGWYWVIILPDGTEQVITDENRNPIIMGKDGQDAISPQVRINPETGEWETSTDGGHTWQSTGVTAAGLKGDPGPRGYTGENGADAQTAIVKVEIVETPTGKMLQFTTSGGTVFQLPYIEITT